MLRSSAYVSMRHAVSTKQWRHSTFMHTALFPGAFAYVHGRRRRVGFLQRGQYGVDRNLVRKRPAKNTAVRNAFAIQLSKTLNMACLRAWAGVGKVRIFFSVCLMAWWHVKHGLGRPCHVPTAWKIITAYKRLLFSLRCVPTWNRTMVNCLKGNCSTIELWGLRLLIL